MTDHDVMKTHKMTMEALFRCVVNQEPAPKSPDWDFHQRSQEE